MWFPSWTFKIFKVGQQLFKSLKYFCNAILPSHPTDSVERNHTQTMFCPRVKHRIDCFKSIIYERLGDRLKWEAIVLSKAVNFQNWKKVWTVNFQNWKVRTLFFQKYGLFPDKKNTGVFVTFWRTFWLQVALNFFLWVIWWCSRYLKGFPR